LKKTFEDLNQQLGTTEQRRAAIQQLRSVVENLNAVNNIDYEISDAMFRTIEQYLNGIINKETAIQTIMEKLWLFENESMRATHAEG